VGVNYYTFSTSKKISGLPITSALSNALFINFDFLSCIILNFMMNYYMNHDASSFRFCFFIFSVARIRLVSSTPVIYKQAAAHHFL
jgi:hypothetical protein